MQSWLINIVPSVWCQRLSVGISFLAALLLIVGLLEHQFPWLLAGVGVCILALITLHQRPEFLTIDTHGRGIWGSEGESFILTNPMLSTPWLLMLRIHSAQGQRWLFVWQDSVDVDNWCRLRRIAKTFTSVLESTNQALK